MAQSATDLHTAAGRPAPAPTKQPEPEQPKVSFGAVLQALTVIETEAANARRASCLAVELSDEASRGPRLKIVSGDLVIPDQPMAGGDLMSEQDRMVRMADTMRGQADRHMINCLGKAVALAEALGLLDVLGVRPIRD